MEDFLNSKGLHVISNHRILGLKILGGISPNPNPYPFRPLNPNLMGPNPAV
jgi:hypothetical protein